LDIGSLASGSVQYFLIRNLRIPDARYNQFYCIAAIISVHCSIYATIGISNRGWIFDRKSRRQVPAAYNFGVKVRKTWFGPRDKDARRRAQEIGAGEGPPFIAE
jgi:hypothetical protein